MEKEHFFEILQKYRTGKATEEEKSFLSAYYNLFEAEADVIKLLSDDERNKLKDKIKSGLAEKISQESKRPAKIYTLMRRLAVAASVLLLLSVGLYVYLQSTADKTIVFKNNRGDISPGGKKAILTLANGEKIDLTYNKTGAIAMQGNTSIIKDSVGQVAYNAIKKLSVNSADTAHNTITTQRGGEYLVVLPDSSRVFLNSVSSLRFPVAFNGKERDVILTGEAYFEIAHNKNKPFKVTVKGQTVTVLGTHFNVNAYDDERMMRTTLLEGSVKVTSGAHTAILVPGQQAQVNGTGASSIDISNVDTDDAVAWKNGLFHFENADVKEVMREFAKWYDVDVTYSGKIQERLFSGDIHKDLKISQALELLNYANLHFMIDGRKITVSP